MTVWYNTLESWQQCSLWTLILLSVAGVIRLLYMCYHVCWYDKHLVQLYFENAERFATKYRNNLNNSEEGVFLLRKSNEVSHILEECVYDMPALEFAAKIKYSNVKSAESLDNLLRGIIANYLKWDEKRKDRMAVLLLQLFLPLVFWPFRGIEAFLLFLSEILQILHIKSFKPDGKFVLVLSVIGGVLGFFGSIASILSFLGLSFSMNG